VFVEARYKHVKIQHLGSRPYIPEALHVILDQQRTDHTIANNTQRNCGELDTSEREETVRFPPCSFVSIYTGNVAPIYVFIIGEETNRQTETQTKR